MYTVTDPRQSIFDVTVQKLGAVEQVFALLDANGLDINADLFAGRLLQMPAAKLPDRAQEVADYMADNNLRVAGSLQAAQPAGAADFDARDFDQNDFFAA
jgi:hypothetical protein